MPTRLQLAAIHEAGHIIVADRCGLVVNSAWLHQITDGSNWGSGGFISCDIPEPTDGVLSRQEFDKSAKIIMAGIAAELIAFPSLAGSPYPWSGHQDAEVGGTTASGLPTDVALLESYLRLVQPPILEKSFNLQITRAFQNATTILGARRVLIGTIADALGTAYANGETKLSADDIRRLLGR